MKQMENMVNRPGAWSFRGTGILTGILALVLALGCSGSDEGLYVEGKAQLFVPETMPRGIDTLNRFIQRHPRDERSPDALLSVAMAQQNLGNIELAEKAYNRLVDDYPDTPEAFKGMFLLGYMYFDEGSAQDKTRAALERFIAAYPDSDLTVSARVLLDNIGKPVDEWDNVRALGAEH